MKVMIKCEFCKKPLEAEVRRKTHTNCRSKKHYDKVKAVKTGGVK